MGHKIDPAYKNYKIFRLKLAAEQVKISKILPTSFMNLLGPDPSLLTEWPDPHVLKCRKCRRIVALQSNLITHKPKDLENSYESPVLKRTSQSAHNFLEEAASSNDIEAIVELTEKIDVAGEKLLNGQESAVCTRTFFVEPLLWMKKEVVNNVEGKLYCPSCKSKIGSFNWIMAARCKCGEQVSPNFYLVPSKVDFSNVVQNIMQVTV